MIVKLYSMKLEVHFYFILKGHSNTQIPIPLKIIKISTKKTWLDTSKEFMTKSSLLLTLKCHKSPDCWTGSHNLWRHKADLRHTNRKPHCHRFLFSNKIAPISKKNITSENNIWNQTWVDQLLPPSLNDFQFIYPLIII